jgi:CYTH domain-containing protein
MVEIERKWLVARDGVLPEECRALLAQHGEEGHSRIEQGYFYNSARGNAIRLRKTTSGDQVGCFITVKSAGHSSNMVRQEYENEVCGEVFDALWPLTEGRRIQKTRYHIPLGANTVELDVYKGVWSGLVIAEIEFDSEVEAVMFKAPRWLGTEVTGDTQYSNHNLAIAKSEPTSGSANKTSKQRK